MKNLVIILLLAFGLSFVSAQSTKQAEVTHKSRKESKKGKGLILIKQKLVE